MTGNRAALPHPVLTGISREHLGSLTGDLAGPWAARQEPALRERRGGRDRPRADGGGRNHRLPFTDRVIASLVIMRFQVPHAALAVFYQVDRSTGGERDLAAARRPWIRSSRQARRPTQDVGAMR